MKSFVRTALFLGYALAVSTILAQESPKLDRQMQPWLDVLQGKSSAYSISGWAQPVLDSKPQRIDFRLVRYDDNSFDLEITHEKYAVQLRRRADATAMALPKHHQVYLGQGSVDENDQLSPLGFLERLISSDSVAEVGLQTLWSLDSEQVVGLVQAIAKIEYNPEQQLWKIDGKHELKFNDAHDQMDLQYDKTHAHLELSTTSQNPLAIDDWQGYSVTTIERVELERQLARGFRRTCEILAPSTMLTAPSKRTASLEHGQLRWIDDQRVCLLSGTPEQIGQAHGELLAKEATRCIDSVLYAFGTAQTISTGRWFRSDLEAAYARLAPHIPERHKAETRAIAASLNVDPHLMETLNVFPELFHCSGFALFGSATVDGKLYHGRVLDYMTTIGLQDAATTFIVAPDGMIPFVNVGYAGFVGSVSGMNAQKISLGEMGGHGEGQWDGVPMATLMRRALEECDSLDEVKNLWSSNPRTCEYFYVFADGEDRSAVGVAATPQSIEFVPPGAAHPRLGDGITDSVVLSAGSRLQELRGRVQNQFGKIDAAAAMQLMCRPVAMKSNLHNVLFVPEDGVLYVANANHKLPAADRPYTKLDLNQLLGEEFFHHPAPAAAIEPGQKFTGSDSLNVGTESNSDAAACLSGLQWEPVQFDVLLQEPDNENGDLMVRFASPRPSGNTQNDLVAMEWYQAKDSSGKVIKAPAAVVVHESGSGMHVGRLIAQRLCANGIHTFMIQLPYYGVRRPPEGRARGAAILQAIQQAVGDVRRARDAVASLPMIDSQHISVQGTSLGGFVTATVGGMDHGYENVIIFLAGGNLYETLAGGKRDAAKVRAELVKAGLSDEQIREGLSSIEPLRLAHRLNPESTWVFSGVFDTVVPPASSQMLASAAGLDQSHHVKMLADHYTGIVYLPTVALRASHIIKGDMTTK